MAGRRTKLSAELKKRLLSYIAAGNYQHVACAAVGIDNSTFTRWWEKGEAGHEPYATFCKELTRAEIEAQANLVELVRSHAIGDWRAAAFLLERKHKKDWGRHETIEATVTQQLDEDLDL